MEPTQTHIQQPVQTPPKVIIPQSKPNYIKKIIFSILIIITLSLIGYLILQNQKLQKQVLNPPVSPTIQAPSPTPKTVSSISIPPDETAEWNIYKNNNGYSIKYPNDWIAKSSVPGPGEIDLTSNSRGFTSYPKQYSDITTLFPRIFIDSLDPKMETILGVNDYYSWVNYLKKNQFFKVQKETKSKIGGIEAIIIEGSFESSGIATYHKNYLTHTLSGDKYITIQIDDFADKKQSSTFNQILSTFKFMDNHSICVPTYQVEVNSTELTAKQNYSMRCSEQRSEKDCLSIDLYNQKADDFNIPDKIPDCIWKNPTK